MSKVAKVKLPEMSVDEICVVLQAKTKAYIQLRRMDVRLQNQMKADARLLGLEETDPDEAPVFKSKRKKASDEPARIVKPPTPEMRAALGDVCNGLQAAQDVVASYRNDKEKDIEKLVKMLPVWTNWAVDIRGFGAASLGIIIGMCGNLSNYSNPAKVWKRMGVGLVDGQRQRKVAGDSELAIRMGYRPENRSQMYVTGLGIILSCAKKEGKGSYFYDEVYRNRKEVESAKLNDKGKPVAPFIANLRASRYMQKRLLRDLWCKWNSQVSV